MLTFPLPTLLRVTRWLIFACMGVIIVAGVSIALASVALPFVWPRVLTEIAKEAPQADREGLSLLFGVLFATLLTACAFVWTILKQLLNIIGSVGQGDPFVRVNAQRLRTIGWLLIVVNIVGVPLAIVARSIGERFGEYEGGFDVSLSGILAILLVFVLAGVFEQGAALREDVEGTV